MKKCGLVQGTISKPKYCKNEATKRHYHPLGYCQVCDACSKLIKQSGKEHVTGNFLPN